MGKAGFASDTASTFFIEHVCSEADVVYRFLYALTLSEPVAFTLLKDVFRKAADELPNLENKSEEGRRVHLMQLAFADGKTKEVPQGTSQTQIARMFSPLDRKARAAVMLVDACRCTADEARQVLEVDVSAFAGLLSAGRKAVASELGNASGGNDDAYNLVVDYLNEEISGSDKQKFESAFDNESSRDSFCNALKEARGKFQVSAQDYSLNEDQIVELHEIVETSDLRQTHEIAKIAEVGKSQALSNWRRRLFFLAILGTIVFGIVYLMTPRDSVPFDTLSVLSYEAVALNEEPETRLEAPTGELGEIDEFFRLNPSLGFNFKVITNLPDGWSAEGASVIDYGTVKVATVQYVFSSTGDRIVHFGLKGQLMSLPEAEIGNYDRGRLFYQAYSSEAHNIIAWNQDERVLNLVFGTLSAPELAGFASGKM